MFTSVYPHPTLFLEDTVLQLSPPTHHLLCHSKSFNGEDNSIFLKQPHLGFSASFFCPSVSSSSTLLLYTFSNLTIFLILISPTWNFCSFFFFIILHKNQSKGKRKGRPKFLFCFAFGHGPASHLGKSQTCLHIETPLGTLGNAYA